MNKTKKKYIRKHKVTKKNNKVFNHKDYKSNDGFLTKVWGPPAWFFLHTVSFNYPNEPTEEDKKHYKEFIENLQFVLPCKYCRINLVKNLKQKPIKVRDLINRENFSRYVYELHELVNTMLNKKSNLSYDDVRNRYEHFRARCSQEEKKIVLPKKEMGCNEPLYGKKSKCVIKIVPQENNCETFQMDKKCLKKRVNTIHQND